MAICLQPHGRPYYLKPIDYWNLRDAFAALREREVGLYWDPELAYDANPYFEKSQSHSKASSNGMDEKKARSILGVKADATKDEIMAAYRNLQKLVHPDKGGSTWFSQELNAAKEFLLGE